MKTVSIVIPAYCEEKVIEECYKRVKSVMLSLSRYDHELIFIDDGSTDNTLLLLKDLASRDEKLKILILSRNFGHQIAISSGLDRARGDAVVLLRRSAAIPTIPGGVGTGQEHGPRGRRVARAAAERGAELRDRGGEARSSRGGRGPARVTPKVTVAGVR